MKIYLKTGRRLTSPKEEGKQMMEIIFNAKKEERDNQYVRVTSGMRCVAMFYVSEIVAIK